MCLLIKWEKTFFYCSAASEFFVRFCVWITRFLVYVFDIHRVVYLCAVPELLWSRAKRAAKKHFGVIFAKRENRANKIRIETVSFVVGRKKI